MHFLVFLLLYFTALFVVNRVLSLPAVRGKSGNAFAAIVSCGRGLRVIMMSPAAASECVASDAAITRSPERRFTRNAQEAGSPPFPARDQLLRLAGAKAT